MLVPRFTAFLLESRITFHFSVGRSRSVAVTSTRRNPADALPTLRFESFALPTLAAWTRLLGYGQRREGFAPSYLEWANLRVIPHTQPPRLGCLTSRPLASYLIIAHDMPCCQGATPTLSPVVHLLLGTKLGRSARRAYPPRPLSLGEYSGP